MFALAGALLVGCGPGSSDYDGAAGHGGHDDADLVAVLPSKPSKPMTVQQLASGLGCDLHLAAGKRSGFRQGTCEYNGNHTIMLDFDTDEGMAAWLDLSKHHSGVYYLIGERWLLTVYTLAEVSPLQDKFGGKIEKGHHPPPPATARR